ncbi:MAG: RNB domain-containing ribonuclease, partial [Patescibacteria group bacterium]|nr:RNB domain-containing ribonuclease [Patescibacteria group bacterium]
MAKTKEKAPKKLLTGIIQITRKGTGYVPFDSAQGKASGDEDIEIKNEHLGGALNGDTVEVELIDLFPRPRGKVKKISARAKEEFVATIKDTHTATADDVRVYRPFTLAEASNYAVGEKILVRLLSFDGHSDPKATVVKHLGKAGEHKVEMNAIVLGHGFRTEFPEEAVREARELEERHQKIIEDELPKRTDFRNTPTFTIDPADAKDFDDALSLLELPDGSFEVGVHIADATYFVRPGTALDEEATRRGTSVYLVDSTIPMLPHELSADIASLKPMEERLAFSAVFRL